MQKQLEILENKFNNWIKDENQGKNYKQVDDILIMGLTI